MLSRFWFEGEMVNDDDSNDEESIDGARTEREGVGGYW